MGSHTAKLETLYEPEQDMKVQDPKHTWLMMEGKNRENAYSAMSAPA